MPSKGYVRLTQLCPHCGSTGRIRTSRATTELISELFFACSNTIECGHSWKSQLAFVHTISPSGCEKPGLNLPRYEPARAANDQDQTPAMNTG